MNGLNLPDSQESFSDIWSNTVGTHDGTLFPEIIDLGLDGTENLTEEEFSTLGNEPSNFNDPSSNLLTEEHNFSNDNLTGPDTSVLLTLESSDTKREIIPITDYPGSYLFDINFGKLTESATKNAPYTYSHSLKRLFVRRDEVCPFHYNSTNNPPIGSIIRVVPVFKKPEHRTEIVTRCLNHRQENDANSINPSTHLVWAEMSPSCEIKYGLTTDGRENVSVLYESPQVGMDSSTMLFKFMCLSSCKTGINRRPLVLVFYLENSSGDVIGRRIVDICICACPGRDRTREEEKAISGPGPGKKLKRPSQSAGDAKSPKQKKQPDDETFVITVHGREKYERLLEIKRAFDLEELVSSEQREEYLRNEALES